jgi:ribokinase
MPALDSVERARDTGYVLVIGSANVDVSVTTQRLPRAGETVPGGSALLSVGGKGANQAVAAAAGAPTLFLGRVGDDDFGRLVRATLGRRGVGLDALVACPGTATGMATIAVEESSGQNCIIVVAGANGMLEARDIDAAATMLRGAAVVVLQCEVPLAAVYRAAELAVAAGVPCILNPAPCQGLDLARLPRGIDYLIPNEAEAATLSGLPCGTPAEALRSARQLQRAGARCVIITLGAEGCVVADASGARHLAAHPVKAVDTTGAGDAFVGCFAAGLAARRSPHEALCRARVYAALSTTHRGAQASFPACAEFEAAVARLAPPPR